MPTLANIQGGSLVPDTSGLNNLLLNTFGTKQSRDREAAALQTAASTKSAIQDQTNIIAGEGTDKEKQAALVRLSTLNPQAGKAVAEALDRGDQAELAGIVEETKRGTVLALQIQGKPDFLSKQKALAAAAQTASANGADVTRFVELSNLSEPQLDLELEKMMLQGSDIQKIAGDALTPSEGFTLSPGQERFVDGVKVAGVAPKSDVLSPEAQAQKVAIATARSGSSQAPVVIPAALLKGLSPEVAEKVGAAFVAAGGGKDGITAIDKVMGDFDETERRQLAPNIITNSFPNASPSEREQLDATVAAAKTVSEGLKEAQTVRTEQRRLVKAQVFQDRGVALLTSIIENPQLGDVIGSIEGSFDTRIFSDAEAELIADIEEAGNIFTADNLSLMSGVLSESDIKILKNLSGGALNRKRTEKRFIGDVTQMRDRLSSETVQTTDQKAGQKVGRFNVKVK